ncbi:hypothetical protein, partial [Kozakia baliensis]
MRRQSVMRAIDAISATRARAALDPLGMKLGQEVGRRTAEQAGLDHHLVKMPCFRGGIEPDQ